MSALLIYVLVVLTTFLPFYRTSSSLVFDIDDFDRDINHHNKEQTDTRTYEVDQGTH